MDSSTRIVKKNLIYVTRELFLIHKKTWGTKRYRISKHFLEENNIRL